MFWGACNHPDLTKGPMLSPVTPVVPLLEPWAPVINHKYFAHQ